MKKFVKLMSVLAALAMLGASFVSCSSEDDEDEPTKSAPTATVYTCDNCGAKYDTAEKKANCAVKAGCPKYEAPAATKFTCTGCGTEYDTEAEKNNCAKQADCPKYVAPAPTKYTCDGCGTEYDTEAEKNNCAKQEGCPKYVAAPTAVDYTADFLTFTSGTAVTADSYIGNGNDSTPVATLAADYSPLVFLNSKNGVRLRKETNNVNLNGGTKAAFAVTTVGEVFTDTLDRYLGVDISKLATSGNLTVKFVGTTKGSKGKGGENGQIVLIDNNNKVLAALLSQNLETDTAFEISADIDASVSSLVKIGFSRGGGTGGGLDITGLTVKSN